MKNRGFTLVELLAVIVILGIVALIATPIVIGMIRNARTESNYRSIELYASAVKNGIAAYQLRQMKPVSAGLYNSSTLPFDVEYKGDVECDRVEIYKTGAVYVGECTVNNKAIDYNFGTKQYIPGVFKSICLPVDGTNTYSMTFGTEYNCKVDPNEEPYTFYVLNSDEASVNLIMSHNINSDGTIATQALNKSGQNVYNLVEWINSAGYVSAGGQSWGQNVDDNAYGPITALNFLSEATKNWTNLDAITINSFSNHHQRTKEMKEYKTHARLPHYSELSNSASWLTDNLSGITGYWTFSSHASNNVYSWYVNDAGERKATMVSATGIGVRPVITISTQKNQL